MHTGTHSFTQACTLELIHSFKVVIIFSVSGIVLGPADTVIEKRDEGVLGEGRIQFK